MGESSDTSLAGLDATACAQAIKDGQVSPLEVMDGAIERIERLNPQINAVIHPRFEAARARAEELTRDPAAAAGAPFAGVPVAIKDLGAAQAGEPYGCGLLAAKKAGYVAPRDSAVIRRILGAGFIPVGRTNTPELGSTITTEPVAWGASRNPWDTGRSTGGSSGGSAAAVASGMVPVAHASDGGGSIRIPAANCGLVGLKPSRGRVSAGPDKGEGWMGASTNGGVARSVRDAAAFLDLLSGPEVGDPYFATPFARPLSEEVGVQPGRLRVGVLDRPPAAWLDPAPEPAAAVAHAASLLGSLGHAVDASSPSALAADDEEFRERFLTVVAAGVAADLAEWARLLGTEIADDDVERTNAALRHIGNKVSAPDYVANINWLHGFSRRVAAWWEEYDLLLCPVINGVPPEIGYLSDDAEGSEKLSRLMAYTSQFNITGQPSVSLPLYVDPGTGLPVGIQLVGAYGREDLLVRVAAQLEQADPWAERRPGLFG